MRKDKRSKVIESRLDAILEKEHPSHFDKPKVSLQNQFIQQKLTMYEFDGHHSVEQLDHA